MEALDTDLSRAVWRKSAHSNNGGACVEAADLGSVVAVRDSKDPSGPKLRFAPEDWRNFLRSVQTGSHDLGP